MMEHPIKTPPFPAASIANFFLNKDSISPMKLQKLIYFAHAWHLALYEKPLINETVEAWQFGPVIPSIYHEFKVFGNDNIKDKARVCHISPTDPLDWKMVEVPGPQDETVISLLEKIWEIYGKFTAIQLSNLTHKPDDPWDKTIKESKEKNGFIMRGLDINNDRIKEIFKNRLSHA